MSNHPSVLPLPPHSIATIPWANYWELLCFLCRKRLRFQVQGHSMQPLLHPHEEVLVIPKKVVQIGDIVVLKHPYKSHTTMIKYVAQITTQSQLYVLGTNLAESTDSRSLGYLSSHLLYGCVRSKLPPLSP